MIKQDKNSWQFHAVDLYVCYYTHMAVSHRNHMGCTLTIVWVYIHIYIHTPIYMFSFFL